MGLTDTFGPKQVFSAIILLAGIGMIGFGGYEYVQQSKAMQNAIETEATITSLGTEEVIVRRAGTKYVPTATFEYRFQGESFNSSNVFPTGSSPNYDSRAEAQAALEDYELGEPATAYVDPSAPGNAFLKDKASKVPYEFLGIGGLTVLVGGFNFARQTIRDS